MSVEETGQVSLLMAITVTGVLLLIAVVYDGGEILAAKRRAANEAQSAARAGAQAVDAGSYRQSGEFHLDPVAAESAAREFLVSTGYTGTVHADLQRVQVTVTQHHPTVLLGIIGINDVTIEERAESMPLHGVEAALP